MVKDTTGSVYPDGCAFAEVVPKGRQPRQGLDQHEHALLGLQSAQEQQGLRLAQHAAPGGLRRLRAQPQVGQRGLGQDGDRDGQIGWPGQALFFQEVDGLTFFSACINLFFLFPFKASF